MSTSPSQIENYISEAAKTEASSLEEKIDAKMRAREKYDDITGDFVYFLPFKIIERDDTLALLVERYALKGWVYIQARNNKEPDPAGYHLYFSQSIPDPLPEPEDPLFPVG